MAKKAKTLSELGALTNPEPEVPEVAETAAPAEDAPPPPPPQIEAVLREQQLDKYGRAYATGRRKDAIARVWLKPGSGKILVNGRDQMRALHLYNGTEHPHGGQNPETLDVGAMSRKNKVGA